MGNQTQKNKSGNRYDLKRIAGIAMFAALAYGVTFVFRIPVSFLTFDAKDAVITIAAFIYGPVAAVFMSLIAALLELITISGTGLYGFVMNFASSACFSALASLVYKHRRSLNGAIIGLYIASATTLGAMMLLNILITPHYMGVQRTLVIDLIPTLLLPFNAAKTLMNSAIAMLLYKPVSLAMKRARLVEGKMSTKFNKNSVIMLVVGGITLAVAVTIFVILNTK